MTGRRKHMNHSGYIRGCIDRFDGNFALIELPDHAMLRLLRSQLPDEARPGDWLLIDQNGCWQIDEQGTESARQRISQLMDELFE
ncbi:MAG: DUF3006 domain-containing protein [Clostridia bacterium]|nr:DUF3006 domain-containing protein [Clostridia bacterium]